MTYKINVLSEETEVAIKRLRDIKISIQAFTNIPNTKKLDARGVVAFCGLEADPDIAGHAIKIGNTYAGWYVQHANPKVEYLFIGKKKYQVSFVDDAYSITIHGTVLPEAKLKEAIRSFAADYPLNRN